jgi:methylmalonyl-CoA mutase
MTNLLSLAAAFDANDETAWRALAEAALKGAPFERLSGKTNDGVSIHPLYRESDFPSSRDGAGLPGQAPFIRGPRACRDPYLPWDIRAPYRHSDPRQTNQEILEDLSRGVSSIELLIGARTGGVTIASGDDLSRTLEGVKIDLAPIALNAGQRGLEIAALLAAHFSAGDTAPFRPAFNLDPVSTWLLNGAIPDGFDNSLTDAARFAADACAQFTDATFLRASGRAAHESGAGPAQEVALMLAAGVTYLRALDIAGVGPQDGGRMILFTSAAGPDVMLEMAKLRAVRGAWARVMAACGARAEARSMRLHAITSRRMLTRDDPWTNILRATAACFSAGAGGADIITVLPFTTPLGPASAQARRLARNTQIILQEESHLGRVSDPGGGAWALEKLTQEITENAWSLFQRIEGDGGLPAALRNGWFQQEIDAARARAGDEFARRKRFITGVTDFPLLGAPAPALGPASPPDPAPASWGSDAITPCPWMRWAEPFEALRKAGENANAPKVFAATLGPLAEFSARAGFAKNLCAIGGVTLVGEEVVYRDHAALLAAFAQASLPVAILCGDDAAYGREAAALAGALKSSGCDWLIMAGKPADEAALRAAGFDQFVFAGQNTLESLATIHAALGIGA